MQEPSPRTSRLAIAGSLAALIVVGGSGFLLGRATLPAPPPASHTPAPTTPPPPTDAKAPVERILSRADLIALGNSAADSFASGQTLPAAADAIAGQRFELLLPFGCDGPAAEGSEAALQWRYDREASTLRVRVTPTSWDPAEWWQTPPSGLETLEGFWIARPWSSGETCSAGGAISTPTGTEPITFPGQTLGLAQIVTKETPRQLRRDGKPYESLTRVAPEALKLDTGLRVRLSGRIAEFPDGKTVRCTQSGGREQRPVCLVAATIEEVAIDNPATGEKLAVWSPTVGNRSGS
jgi:hypothetical protein